MEIIDVAVKAAEKASEVLKKYHNELKASEVELKARNDYVTKADTEAEKVIIEEIKTHFPDHSIVAEESGISEGNSYKWFIDPLDGTKNFIHGLPFFCISIGVMYKDELIAGAIQIPFFNEIFTAERGSGTFRNGEKVKVSERDFTEGLFATGFPFRGKDMLDDYLPCFKEVFLNVSGVRRCGAAAIDLAYTACGIFDGFWELSLKPWDIAAGVLMIEEAGGIVSDFKGSKEYLKSGNIIGASEKSYHKLFEIVNKHLGSKY